MFCTHSIRSVSRFAEQQSPQVSRFPWSLASAVLTVSTAGSKPSGSQIRSSRDTAGPGTNAQPIPVSAQFTEILCSAEKPATPKNSRLVRSRSSPRQRTRRAIEYSVRVRAFVWSMAPRALTTATDDFIQLVSHRANGPSRGVGKGMGGMASSAKAEGCSDVSDMVIPSCGRSPAMLGLGACAPWVQQRTAQPIPNQLRFSAVTTLLRFLGSAQVSRLHIRNRKAATQTRLSLASQLHPKMGLSRGGCALGTWLVAGYVGLQQDCEAGTTNDGVHPGR